MENWFIVDWYDGLDEIWDFRVGVLWWGRINFLVLILLFLVRIYNFMLWERKYFKGMELKGWVIRVEDWEWIVGGCEER